MSLYRTYTDESVLWGIWKIEETQKELYGRLPDPESIRPEIEELKTECRQTERLAVRVLLFELLREQKEILYYPSGRPHLYDDCSWNISISHTQGYVAVLLCRSKECGVDIERYGERIRRVVSKFMRPDEQLFPYNGVDTWSMLLHWSAKETLFKSMDQKEVDFKKHLHVFPFRTEREGVFSVKEYRTEEQKKYVVHYLLDPEFVFTWSMIP